MPNSLSAIDVIPSAFKQTKRQMFQPFRFGRWARLAVVSLLTGEFASGSWSGASGVNVPQHSKTGEELALLADPVGERVLAFLPWILGGVLGLIGLGLIWLYIESVFRFVLLDAVLWSRYELSQDWRRWQQAGGSYFLWQIGLSMVVLTVLAVVVGVPIYLSWRSGVFREPEHHIGLLLGGGVLLFLAVTAVVLVGMLASLFAKDFVVPVMALENVGVLEGWRRLLPMLGVEKGAYAGYVLVKIVLAVGSAILFGIINLAVILVLLIPLGIGGVGLVLVGKAAGLAWNAYTIGAAIVLGVAALAAIFYAAAFVYAPGMVFFQCYTLHFLGSRYSPLETLLAYTPPSPAAPTAAAGGS